MFKHNDIPPEMKISQHEFDAWLEASGKIQLLIEKLYSHDEDRNISKTMGGFFSNGINSMFATYATTGTWSVVGWSLSDFVRSYDEELLYKLELVKGENNE